MTELLPEFSSSAYLTDNQLSRLTRIPEQAIAAVQRGAMAAAWTLRALLTDPGTPASVKRAAACDLLNFALRAVELEQIESRITALEQAQPAQGGSHATSH